MKIQSWSNQAHADGKSGEVIGHKTFLDLSSKTPLRHSPNQLGTSFKTEKII